MIFVTFWFLLKLLLTTAYWVTLCQFFFLWICQIFTLSSIYEIYSKSNLTEDSSRSDLTKVEKAADKPQRY